MFEIVRQLSSDLSFYQYFILNINSQTILLDIDSQWSNEAKIFFFKGEHYQEIIKIKPIKANNSFISNILWKYLQYI